MREAVILPPVLLLEKRVQNFPFRVAHESIDLGWRLLNQCKAVPLRQVEKKRHLATSECPKKSILPSKRIIKSYGSVDPSNDSTGGTFRSLFIFAFSMYSARGLSVTTSRPPDWVYMKFLIRAMSSSNFACLVGFLSLGTPFWDPSSPESSLSVCFFPFLLEACEPLDSL